MPTYKGPQSSGAKHGSSDSGNAFAADNKVTITANLTTADEVILMDIPAGTRLHGFKYRNGDLDTGTTLAFNLGYRSTHPEAKLVAAPTFFLSASTAGQAAQAGWVDLAFDPITFNEPVQIVLKPTVSATGLSGTPAINAIAEGQVVGVA
jgi:hypothetical protein